MSEFPSHKDILFFAAIGRMAVAWAHLESALDIKVDIARNLGWGKVDPVRPRSLKRKIEYLRKFFKSLNMPDDGMDGYRTLFRAINELAEKRHDIIHGAVVEHAEDAEEIKLIRFLYSDESLGKKPVTVTTDSVMDTARRIESLSHSIFQWIEAISRYARERAQSDDMQSP
ncbi:hypothetical protein [Nitratireductor sp.]|uniref:hypothetical protein n=1 Tax=Nitratireductor sp. TaxID=1872084 RepID=UPI0025FCC43E|nr:hypothetical protein [Nitratireductor sp.]